MTSPGTSAESPSLRLARYLKAFVGLRTVTVRDVAKYETVLWFGAMPQVQDCSSPAWTGGDDPDAPWLEVRKQHFTKAPEPPASTLPWVDKPALSKATVEVPSLLSRIYLPDPNAELKEGEAAPLVEHALVNHPEIQNAYERYRPVWEHWSEEQRLREEVQKVYAELFKLHTQTLKQGEIVEVVLGVGLVDWRAKLREKTVPIRRHSIVTRVELEFDPSNSVIRVTAPSGGVQLQIEDDMLEADLRPDRSHYATLQEQLEELGDAIWDKAQMYTALRTWAGALSPDSVWSEELEAISSSGSAPTISFAPALILRKRLQTGMVRIYDKLISQLSGDNPDVPPGWFGLIDDLGESPRGPGNSKPTVDESEIYFPLLANREQKRIVKAINQHSGVLVQGPPGTGKSHTIANLMCHLLATGKRVLITAETGRALQVLKDKLPKEIQPLCVSLLGQGGDAFAELNSAVQGITTRQASFSPGSYDDRINQIDTELDEARRLLAKIDTKIRSLREDEASPYSIGNGIYHGTASSIAERVARENDQYNWLKLPAEAPAEPPISSEEAIRWLGICRTYTAEQITQAKLRIPTSAQLPTPPDFAGAVAGEAKALAAVDKIAERLAHPAYVPIRTLALEARKTLQKDLEKVETERLYLERVEDIWQKKAVSESLRGRPARWSRLLTLSREQLAKLDPLLTRLGDQMVTILDGLNARKVRGDAGAALAYFRAGGKWKRFGMFTPKPLKGRTYLQDQVQVNGEACADIENLQTVCDHLDIEFAYSDLHAAWNDVGAPLPSGHRHLRIAQLKEQISMLQCCTSYVILCRRIAQLMSRSVPPIPEPDWLDGQVQLWQDLIEASYAEDRFFAAQRTIDSCHDALAALRELYDLHPLVKMLLDAVQARNVQAYSKCYVGIVAVERMRFDLQERACIEGQLNDSAAGLVSFVVANLDDEAWDTRFTAFLEAWHWAIADAWLEKRSDSEFQRDLWRRRHEADKNIGRLLAEAAALHAWVHFFKRLTPRETAALRSWREAVRAMGKGTGRSAKVARLRREARQYMDACRDAIPVWIMPRYLVAEMIDPNPGRYDLVIVDEASQLGIDSLFLFYIAKKMIVVGDDQQISPYGIGIADEAIVGLQQHYLDGIPHKHALSPQSSLYGNAKIRFIQNIVLREHFRCMPEIIQFSNDLCYASNGTPLDPLRAYPANRLQPLVLRHVGTGYRTGGSQDARNPAEADAIVAQIKACIEDTRYAQRTMGVISLQGEAQAKLIERKLLETLDPEVIEERRLISGDAYAFQGDERNVIFLSMVAAPGEKRIGALTKESARQRFNVAVSRAQDQLWLFHTAQLDVLSPACMRYRLLSYMLDPSRKPTPEGDQRFDSDFERYVYQRITAKGFHVRTQVCVGDPTNHRYRIDLVVEGMQGRLAVECDGDKWHGPDRYEQDMARQRDLERAGWQFARIRGGDFYRNPNKAMESVWAELERLGIQPGGIDDAVGSPPPVPATIEEPATKDTEPTVLIGSKPPATETRHIFVTPRTTYDPAIRAPYICFQDEAGPDPRQQANHAQVVHGLVRIIKVEGPMLAKRAYDIYLRSSGILRMGGELKHTMNKALQRAIVLGHVVKEDESDKGDLMHTIVRTTGTPPLLLRERGPRDFGEIPPSELQFVAKWLVTDKYYESGSDAHLHAVLEFFDLKRLTAQVGMALLDILERQYPYVEESLREKR